MAPWVERTGYIEMIERAGLRRSHAGCRQIRLVLCLAFAAGLVACHQAEWVQAAFPPTRDVVTDDFEGGSLASWRQVSDSDLSLVLGGGHDGSTGLSVSLAQHKSYLSQARTARAQEGYLTFWFNPNGVSIPDQGTLWNPDRSIRIANITGSDEWNTLVALRLRGAPGKGYRAYLEWHTDDGTQYDHESGEFELVDGWQKLTLGFRVDEWVAVWLNDFQVRRITDIAHAESFGDIVEVGKISEDEGLAPAGALRFDKVAYQVPLVEDLWVDAVHGDDNADGQTADTAFRTIQNAANLAGPGTTVHIMPGIYRETIWPAMSGSATEPMLYLAENGPGTAIIRGSESSRSLSWTQLAEDTIGLPPGVDPTSIFYADLSTWELEGAPRFIVALDEGGSILKRLPLAREPDWQVKTEWKHHEFWWAADGGSGVANCDPTIDPDCDLPSRSMTQLTDPSHDAGPPGIQPGNLTTLGDLTGATLVALDANQGHYVYRRTIVAHELGAGRITVDEKCQLGSGSGEPGLGWGTKYYVEGRPNLLDTPGEWWYDEDNRYLYIWPAEAGDPAALNLEIARRDHGFKLKNRSYVTLDGLVIEILNENAVDQSNGDDSKSYHNVVRNAILRYANRGIDLGQDASGPADMITDGFSVEDSEIAHMDTQALYLHYRWDGGTEPNSFTHAGIVNTVVTGNELHHLGFRTDRDSAVGMVFARADTLRFEHNHVHDVAHNGVQFSKSVIQSPQDWDLSPEEIKTGEILIKDNLFEKACQLTGDCGALKVWGDPPDEHVFRDVLITGNVFRDTIGWTYISEMRGFRSGGAGSDVQGMGGRGLYIDHASGIHVYRNIAYNNAFAGFVSHGAWPDGDMIYFNNIAANSLHGIKLGGLDSDTHSSVNTQVLNNIVVNNEARGIWHADADGLYNDSSIDHNLYYRNGWRSRDEGGLHQPGAMAVERFSEPNEYFRTLAEIKANTPWEVHGVEGDPGFLDYDPDDHDLHDGSWPDFHVAADSTNVHDRGVADLPASLSRLLVAFGVRDTRFGIAFDVGRFEGAGAAATPAIRLIEPGGSTDFKLNIYPPSFPESLTLTVESLSPDLIVDLSSSVLSPGETVVLTVTDTRDPGSVLMPGMWYVITITAVHEEDAQSTSVRVLVGGARLYLPLVLKKGPAGLRSEGHQP